MNYVIAAIVLLAALNGYSQSNVTSKFVSAYNISVTDSYSVEWAVGEVITETFSSEGHSLTSGLNSTSGQFIITTADFSRESSKIESYPNPFSEVITVRSLDFQHVDLDYELIDLHGRPMNILIKKNDPYEVTIQPENISSGLYFLVVRNKSSNQIINRIKLARQ